MALSINRLNPFVKGYNLLIGLASHLQSPVLLVIRIAWGFELFLSGRSHLSNVPAMAERFQQWGVPFPHANVYISAGTEMIGGLLLLLGIGSRLIAIPLFFNFVVAYLTASRETVVHLFTKPFTVDTWDNFFSDTAWPFLVAVLVILAFGPGKISIDYLLQRTIFRNSQPPRSYGFPISAR